MFESFAEKYALFYLNADLRTRDRFLMGSPASVVIVCVTYLMMTWISLKIVENNPTLKINHKKCIFVSNFIILISSTFVVIKIIKYMIWSKYDFRCMPLDLSMKPEVVEVRY